MEEKSHFTRMEEQVGRGDLCVFRGILHARVMSLFFIPPLPDQWQIDRRQIFKILQVNSTNKASFSFVRVCLQFGLGQAVHSAL